MKYLTDYYISELVDIREKVRREKQYDLADRIRDYLDTKDVFIFDSLDGQIVYYKAKRTTRIELIKKMNKEKQANKLFDSWLYSMNSNKRNEINNSSN